jgi:hypothetical protein
MSSGRFNARTEIAVFAAERRHGAFDDGTADRRDGRGRLGLRASHRQHMGAAHGQHAHGLKADARGTARHQRCLAGQIDARRHLFGGGPLAEGAARYL